MVFQPTIARTTVDAKTFKYLYFKTKKEVTNEQVLEYIYSLRIPPAWTAVKISPDPESKIAAIGFDVAGRRQYIYTAKHNETVRRKKYRNLIDLGSKINAINRDLDRYLSSSGLTKPKIVALIVKIIMLCNFRIGTEKGVDLYQSTGITTLKKKHITLTPHHINIKFIGKKGVLNSCNVLRKGDTLTISNLVAEMHDKAKKNDDYLFLHKGERITFLDINNFLKRYGNITSKSFRTWNANVILLQYLPYYFEEKTLAKRRKYLNMIVKDKVAPALHHTVAICKKSYLLKELLELYVEQPDRLKSIVKPDQQFLYKTTPRLEIMHKHQHGRGKIIPKREAIKYFVQILRWFAQRND